MKVIFAGYRKWSYTILKNLLKKKSKLWEISAIITTDGAEAPFNKLPLHSFIENPKKLDDPKVLKKILRIHPDVFLFYGWSWMIPKKLYENFPCIVLHPSPLPKYRGGSPLQNQIMKGEEKSAVTLFKVGEKIDNGPIYVQKEFSLSGTLDNVFSRIVTTGTSLTKKVLDRMAKNSITPFTQNEKEATEYKRRSPKESEITIQDFKKKTARELYNFIRALADPYPNAFFVCKDGKKIIFKEIEIEND
ncbi:MAG TPA: formyltransferase family protein [Patescibacteria group bacterium]|nr:formyltransferase family protein [Patescibacteria group bacterium]